MCDTLYKYVANWEGTHTTIGTDVNGPLTTLACALASRCCMSANRSASSGSVFEPKLRGKIAATSTMSW